MITSEKRFRALFGSATSFVLLAACGGAVETNGAPAGNAPPGSDGGVKPSPTSSPTPVPPNATSVPPSPPLKPPPIPGRNLCSDLESPFSVHNFSPFANVVLAKQVDYLELRDEPGPMSWDAGFSPQPIVEATMGAACASASNKAACLDALKAPGTGSTWPGYSGGQLTSANRYLHYTAGDTVGVARNLGEFLGLFGSVDTEEEAALLADLQNYRFHCDGTSAPNAFREGDSFRLVMLYAPDWSCPYPPYEREIRVSPTGAITVLGEKKSSLQFGCAGRRPEGFASDQVIGATPLGAWLATTAALEAASVPAFERLARELEAHGAPKALVDRARQSADDEVRHHALMQTHAQRFGAAVASVDVGSLSARSLFDVALENAVEGCVRETFAALVATFQAKRAEDRALAASLVEIAADETRHAALSWDCAAWAESMLSDDERRAIAQAKRAALDELRVSLDVEVDAELAAVAGLPTRSEALALFALVEEDLAA